MGLYNGTDNKMEKVPFYKEKVFRIDSNFFKKMDRQTFYLNCKDSVIVTLYASIIQISSKNCQENKFVMFSLFFTVILEVTVLKVTGTRHKT
jgi:hypothetical protein